MHFSPEELEPLADHITAFSVAAVRHLGSESGKHASRGNSGPKKS
jgi:hypothetical protein